MEMRINMMDSYDGTQENKVDEITDSIKEG